MKIYMTMTKFQPWAGAVDTYNKLIENDLFDTFLNILEDLYPDGISETELNDILWFESEWVYEIIGLILEDESV